MKLNLSNGPSSIPVFVKGPEPREAPMSNTVTIPKSEVEDFCRHHHIRRLSLFGSVLRDDFSDDSDIDVLVEFEPGHTPGFGFITLQDELSDLFGRTVDLNTPQCLSRYFRDRVLAEAEVQYAAL
jgi:hypothetical protein